jgi:molecular chaperone DnaK (HSP70)
MDIFKLNRNFWDFAFANPDKIKPNHCSVYYFSIEHCNRLGWKKKFGFPTSMVMEATGIKSYSVYKKTFDELCQFGFFEIIELSKNQYSSNIIALQENFKANDKALDKAFIKHTTKQDESTIQSTGESISSINIQETNLPINKITIEERKLKFADTLKPFLETYGKDLLNDFFKYWTEPNKSNTKFKQELEKTWSLERRLETWSNNDKNFNKDKQTIKTNNYKQI